MIEITQYPDDEEQPLFEELSALEQAMASEERQEEGTFLTGGNTRDFLSLREEKLLDEELILNPKPVKDGELLLEFLRNNLHRFDAPYAFIGGEANSPDRSRFKQAEVRILIARLSTYESTSLSMSHSLMAQIYQELPYTFCDLTFLPKPNDYDLLKDHSFPVWFGTNSKLAPARFDILSITHAVSMEQLNFVPLLHDSGIPLFKAQRMERLDIPFIVVGGANSGTTAPLSGTFRTKDGKEYAHLIDAVIYGDGEEAAKIFVEVVREGKEKGWTKKQILRSCHGRVPGFYEPDLYEHEYDGKGRITRIYPKVKYAEFPVRRATVANLDTVRTLETKVLPYTGDGASVDVAIAGSVGCIGSAGWGACSFCREGSEGPYRERSLGKVMEALDKATRNQGNKEVSFFSLNFNQYADFFPLVAESVKKGYKVGLISQRVDMLAETPEQIRVQRWLKKSNYTLGVEGISGRMRAYLNKNLQEWELLKVCTEMMQNGAGELKLFMIATGMETEVDAEECASMMEKVNAIREKLGASTRFRISFTPLFPSAFTALQFAPAMAAANHGSKNLNPIFNKAKELGWGRRLSVSGEEPLVSNTINQGGRNITHLLLKSHFSDNFRFYGNVPKGMWDRWKRRIDEDPNIDLDVTWGEKSLDHIFPWEDIAYSTSKEVLWRGYAKAVAYQGIAYCLSTRTIKGVCLSGHTEVTTTHKGLTTIEKTEVGDFVHTKVGQKRITAKYDNGIRPTVRVTTALGYELEATEDHELEWLEHVNKLTYEPRGFKEIRDFQERDRLRLWFGENQRGELLPMPEREGSRGDKEISVPSHLNEALAYAMGYAAGDGNLSLEKGATRICVADHESEDLLKKVLILGEAFGLIENKPDFHRNISTRQFCSRALTDYWQQLELKDRVPKIVKQSPQRVQAAYLKGFFDADGCCNDDLEFRDVTVTNQNAALIKDTHRLLLCHGIVAKLSSQWRKGEWQYTLHLRGDQSIIRYADQIGFNVGKKNERLQRLAEHLRTRENNKQVRWLMDCSAVDQIEKIEKIGEQRVWDITVEDQHHFVANGIVVHNCHVNECGACDPRGEGKPDLQLITNIVGRKVAPVIKAEKIAETARSREKAYHLRILFETNDPIYRFVLKGYFSYAIPRALCLTSDQFHDAYVGSIGHARIAAGANQARDWTFGRNIYDFSLCEMLSESDLKRMIEPANEILREGKIIDLRMDSHMTVLRNDVDFCLYTMFIHNSGMSYNRLRNDISRFFERRSMGRENKIRVKVSQGKGIFKTQERTLAGEDIRQLEYQWMPEHRGTLVRFVISANYNPMSMLEAITGRKAFQWKEYPVFCDTYLQLPEETGEVDVFAALNDKTSNCLQCNGVLEVDLFTGESHPSGTCMQCSLEQYPVEMEKFSTREMKAVEVGSPTRQAVVA